MGAGCSHHRPWKSQTSSKHIWKLVFKYFLPIQLLGCVSLLIPTKLAKPSTRVAMAKLAALWHLTENNQIYSFFLLGVTPWKGTLSKAHTACMLCLMCQCPSKHYIKFGTSVTLEVKVIGLLVSTGQNHLKNYHIKIIHYEGIELKAYPCTRNFHKESRKNTSRWKNPQKQTLKR